MIPNLRAQKNKCCYWCKHGDPQFVCGPICNKHDEQIDDNLEMPVCDDYEDYEDIDVRKDG